MRHVLHADNDQALVVTWAVGTLALAAATAQVRDLGVGVALLLGRLVPGEGGAEGQKRIRVQPQGAGLAKQLRWAQVWHR